MFDETSPEEKPRSVVITDERLMDIALALINLNEIWRNRIKLGTLKLHDAVRIGSKLDTGQQQRFMEFAEDVHIPEKYTGKILHAFALDMPEWSIHYIFRIYKLGEKIKAAVVMLNDVMDEFEERFQQFEYEFLENQFPKEAEKLERVLLDREACFQKIYSHAIGSQQANYNRSYGDSSFASQVRGSGQEASFATLIGLPESASEEGIQRQSRRLLKKLHPDHGGSAYLFDLIKKAYDNYKNEAKLR